MPKYLFEAKYTAEGAQGLAREGGTARRDAVTKLVESLGGKVETWYYAFGDADIYAIADLPDSAAAVALTLAVNQSG